MLDYKIKLYVKGIYDLEFDEKQISLGTQTKETLDRTYDTSSLEILLTNIPGEFQPYTEVILQIYTTDDKGKVDTGIYHHLMIEQDEIDDVYIGTETRYNHKITLIESTKILETELMPNITFTQPVKNKTLGSEYDVEIEKAELPEIATSNFGMNGGAQALVAIGTTLVGAGVGLGVSIAVAAAAGSSLGPAGTLIGAGVGLVVGAVIDIIATLSNTDARLLRDFINAMDIKHNVPDTFDAMLVPGSQVPWITITFSVDGFLDKVNRYFGEGGVWQAIGMLLSVYNTIQSIIKWFAWLFDGDDTISFNIPPASILLVEMDSGAYWNLGTAREITRESDAKTLGYTLAKINYYGIETAPRIPTDIPEGNYSLMYSFLINDLWVRDFENWPFDMHWNSMSLNEAINLEGANTTLGQLINGCAMMIYSNLYYDTAISNLVDGKLQAEYSTQPVYLDEFLTKIENQISCRDAIPSIKMTPQWISGIQYNTTTGLEEAANYSYISKRRNFKRPVKTIGVEVDFEDATPYIGQSNYDKARLKVDLDVLFYDYKENYLSLYQDSLTVDHSKNKFSVNFVVPNVDGAKGYKMNLKISAAKRIVDGMETNTLDIRNVSISNSVSREERFRPSKYKFSDKARNLAHIVCPEFTFEGKTLWEICLEIGELFHGIPILREGNIIDFHVVDDNSKKVINFEKEAQRRVVNMTNYATKLYTPELKGIIQDDISSEEGSFCTYPYPGGWIKVRAPEYFTTTIDRKSSAIVIEGENNGIYKIKEVWCKCPILNPKGEILAYKEYNITNYVLEKNVFDTLSEELDVSWGSGATTSEKGTFAYYVQGENAIYNLAQLPDNASILGWKQTHLTIQFLLKKQFDLSFNVLDEVHSSKNIFDYEFRVKYIPKHSRLNITRQSNLADIGYQITSNFNQNSNNISITAFSKFASNTLDRLGNPEILTSYTTHTLKDGIDVGDCIEIKGDNYYVNTKLSTYNNNDKTVQLSLTRDNYKQNDRVAVSREYRQYNIDSNNQVRKTLSKPFTVIVSTQPIQISDESNYIRGYSSKNKQLIAKSIRESINRNTYSNFGRLTNAFVSCYDDNNNILKYNTIIQNRAETRVVNKVLPLIGDCIGNTITLQWDMYDNFSAGRKIKTALGNTLTWLGNMQTTFNSKTINSSGVAVPTSITVLEGEYGIKIQDDCRYCDDLGGCPRIYTSLFSVGKNTSLGDSFSNTAPETVYSKTSLTESVAENELTLNLITDKDSREKLSFQTTISAQTFDKDITIGSLMKVNPLITEIDYSSAKWYGYTINNQPNDSGLYNPNPTYELKTYIGGPLEVKGDAYIYQTLTNKTGVDFIGYVLVAQYKNATPEVLINITKELLKDKASIVYFTVFDDEISLNDTEYVAYPELDLTDFDEYKPIVYMSQGKLYLDISDLKARTGLSYSDIELALITKHATRGRGIPKGYHGRKYQKYKNGESLYHTSNVYCGNPEIDYDKEGNMIKITPFRFKTITVKIDGELVVDDVITETRYNFIEYLMYKKLSKQNYGRGRKKSTYLDYGFRAILKKNKIKSDFRMSHRVQYYEQEASYIETL